MNRTTRTIGFFLAMLALSLFPGSASAAVTENSRTVVGTVKTVDKANHKITIDIGVKDVDLAITPETEVKGGDLAEGKDVKVSTSMKDGKRTATTIKVKGA